MEKVTGKHALNILRKDKTTKIKLIEPKWMEYCDIAENDLEDYETLKEAFKVLLKHSLKVRQIRTNAKCVMMRTFYEGTTNETKEDFAKVEKALKLFGGEE